jgi:hypothetical protein
MSRLKDQGALAGGRNCRLGHEFNLTQPRSQQCSRCDNTAAMFGVPQTALTEPCGQSGAVRGGTSGICRLIASAGIRCITLSFLLLSHCRSRRNFVHGRHSLSFGILCPERTLVWWIKPVAIIQVRGSGSLRCHPSILRNRRTAQFSRTTEAFPSLPHVRRRARKANHAAFVQSTRGSA